MRKIPGLLALFIITSVAGQSAMERPLPSDSLEVDGRYRSFTYYAPEKLSEEPSLVFVMHGSGGTAQLMRQISNFAFEDLAAENKKYIVVYPQGYENHWNDCRASASYAANTEDVDEIGFFSGMIDFFASNFGADPTSVFATGVSNGGHMCFKLAMEMPERFKGIAAFVANLPHALNNDCAAKGIATSMMIINGTADPINPDNGGWVVVGQDSTRGRVLTTRETTDYWLSLLRCNVHLDKVEYPDRNPEDGTTVTHLKYRCSDAGKKVELVRVVNGGHTMPLLDAPPLPEEIQARMGRSNSDVSSPALVLDFFESL